MSTKLPTASQIENFVTRD